MVKKLFWCLPKEKAHEFLDELEEHVKRNEKEALRLRQKYENLKASLEKNIETKQLKRQTK